MREIVDLRIFEKDARQHLAPSVGVTLGGSVRKVIVATNDPLFQYICQIDRDYQQDTNGGHFYLGWDIRRDYRKAELRAAEAFRLVIKHTFEPAGEQCGTIYDDSTACELCGAGATQVTDLILSRKSLPKTNLLAIAKTIADEVIVSERFVKLLDTHGLLGAVLRPIRTREGQGAICGGWQQLLTTSHRVRIVPPTRVGISPSDDDVKGEFRCPRGHLIGLRLISELHISRHDFQTAACDLVFTRECVGGRQGLLRPAAPLVISPRCWQILAGSGLRGFGIEIVHLE